MDQRRAITLVVVVGIVVLVAMVGTRAVGPPDTAEDGAELFEGLQGRLGIGRDVRLEEVDVEGCATEDRDDLSAEELAVVVTPTAACRIAVAATDAGPFALSDRHRTLVLRPAAGSPTVTLRVQGVVVQDELSEQQDIAVDTDGVEVAVSCPLGCEVVVGRPPQR